MGIHRLTWTLWSIGHITVCINLAAKPVGIHMHMLLFAWMWLCSWSLFSIQLYMRTCVSNHQPHHCLLNRLFRRRSKKTSKLGITGFCAGNSPVTGELPAQMASNEENVSIWWRHHVPKWCPCYKLFGDLQYTHLYKYLYKNSIFFHKRVYTMFKGLQYHGKCACCKELQFAYANMFFVWGEIENVIPILFQI